MKHDTINEPFQHSLILTCIIYTQLLLYRESSVLLFRDIAGRGGEGGEWGECSTVQGAAK